MGYIVGKWYLEFLQKIYIQTKNQMVCVLVSILNNVYMVYCVGRGRILQTTKNEKVPCVSSVNALLRVLHAISTKGIEGGSVNMTLSK